MRVLMITDNMSVGGLQGVVALLANGLAKEGLQVAVAASGRGDSWVLLDDNVERIYAPPRGKSPRDILKYVFWLRRLLASRRFDIIHSHQRGVASMALVASAGLRVETVEHVHNTFRPTRLARLVSFRSRHVIACGSAIHTMVTDRFGRDPQRVSLVLNSVEDVNVAGVHISNPPFTTTKLPKIVIVARLNPEKNPDRLIDVAKFINDGTARAEIVWVGGGPLFEHVQNRVEDESVEGLRFIGPRSDVRAILRDVDIVMLTSSREGLPLVLIEGAAHNCALVAPDVGSCRDIIDDGVNGILYAENEDTEAVAVRLREMFGSNHLQTMKRASRTKFESSFTPTRSIEAVKEVYSDVV